MFGRKDGMDMSAFGDAHFATPPEVRDENLLAPKGIRLGYYREPGKRKGWGQVIRYAGDASLTIIAGARSGKTRDFLCPALLEHEQSAIVIDPRGQLASLTKSRREQLGQDVHVLNPYRVFSETLGDPACYNPMDILDPLSPEFDSDCRKLAEGLIARDSDREGHWVSGARSLVAGIIGGLAAHGGVETKNLGYVREVLCSDTLLLKYARASQNSDHAFIRQQLASFAKADPDNPAEVAGFKETAREQTSFLGMKMIAESLRRTDFRFAGLKDKAGTVYIILPDNRLDDCGPWFRLIVASALNELWRGGRGKYRVLTILDEFAQIGHLDILENAAAAAAGRGVQLWPVLQNIPQLKKDYGEVWETFLSASDVQIFMTPREQTSADYISKWIGQRTVMTAGQSVQNSGHLGANKESDTLGQAGQPLIRPDEISKLGKHEAIIIGPHHTVIDALRRPYFHTPELEFLYDPDPLHEHDAVPAPVDPDTITTFADMLVACEERAERERLARRPLAFRLLVWGKSRNPYLNGLLKVEYFATLPLRLLLALLAAPFAIHSRPVGAALGFFALFGFWEVWNGFAKEPFLQLYDFERKTCTQQKYIDDDKWMGHELACKTEALKETASLFWSNAILTFIRSGPGVAAHRLDSVYGNEVGKWNDSVHAYSAHIAAKVTGEFDAVNAKPSSRHQFGETVALNAGAKVDFVPLSALQITEVEQNKRIDPPLSAPIPFRITARPSIVGWFGCRMDESG